MIESNTNKSVEQVLKDGLEADRKLPSEIYEGIQGLLRYYLDLNPDYYPIIALWVMGTYTHNNFSAYPFLYLNAQRGSGKTRLLKMIANLAFMGRGQVQTGITESVLFRELKGSTLVLDECESIASKDKATLREYLNASYKKGATVKRNKKVKKAEGEDYEVQAFEPYRPIALANIYGMNDVLGDRCLTLILEKSGKSEVTKLMENFEEVEDFRLLRRSLNQFSVVMCSVVNSRNIVNEWNNYIKNKYSINYTSTLNNTTTPLYTSTLDELFNKIDGKGIEGRNLELVFPLLLIGQTLGQHEFDKILTIISNLVSSKREEEFSEDKDVSLIDFIASKESLRFDYIGVNDLTRMYRDYIGEVDYQDNWLNSKWLGTALKRLNLVGKKRRLNKGIEVMLAVDRAKEKMMLYKSQTIEVKE